ncbi:MAG: hypothetical protein IKZ88_01355 [Neisseriaceae bacterium]|nr:hypothetical protein [Neisseriaceae bacterium]
MKLEYTLPESTSRAGNISNCLNDFLQYAVIATYATPKLFLISLDAQLKIILGDCHAVRLARLAMTIQISGCLKN